MGVDREGRPVGHVVMCEGHIDGLTLYYGDVDESVTVASLDALEPVTSTAHVSFAAPERDWTVHNPFRSLIEGTRYWLYGGSQDNSWSSVHVGFDLEDLSRLGADQVLFQRYDEAEDDFVDVIEDVEEFEEHACDDWESA